MVGLGLLTKLTIAFFVMALLLGLLLSEQRSLLFNRWLVIAGLIALAMLSPYLIWQASYGFPVLEYTKSYFSSGVAGLLAGIVLVDWLAAVGAAEQLSVIFIGLFLLALLSQRFAPAT